MTGEEVKSALPTAPYSDLPMLVQDIRRALGKAFPDYETGERVSPPFQALAEPGKPLDATVAFRPDDNGKIFYIRIESGKVVSVFPVEYSAD